MWAYIAIILPWLLVPSGGLPIGANMTPLGSLSMSHASAVVLSECVHLLVAAKVDMNGRRAQVTDSWRWYATQHIAKGLVSCGSTSKALECQGSNRYKIAQDSLMYIQVA